MMSPAEPRDLRRLFLWYPLLGVLTVLLFTARADATHITEPSAPINDVVLRLYEYGTNNFAPCGSVVTFDELRIDIIATNTVRPSEHFTVRLTVTDILEGPDRIDHWYDWGHQNVPPHGNPSWRLSQGEHTFTGPGEVRVDVTVTGEVSGQVLTETCTVTKA